MKPSFGQPLMLTAAILLLAVNATATDPTFSDENWVSTNLGTPGTDSAVHAVAVDGSGNLYIGGDFTVVGDVTANHIAKWNGSSWSALGAGVNGRVSALAVSGSNLYAGGWFTSAGVSGTYGIAKWNGSSWSSLGGSGLNLVLALAVSGTNLYAGGSFTLAGGVVANDIAKWNGSSWSALGKGLAAGSVYALAVSGSNLYVGGYFMTATNTGGAAVMVNRIAKWDGSSWSALGAGMSDAVMSMAVAGSNLYAGGFFMRATNSGGVAVSVNRIAKWDGNSWSTLGAGVNNTVSALITSGSNLYAGGFFMAATNTGGAAVLVNRIAKWDGNSWSALGSGINNIPRALAVSGNNFYAGGDFTIAGGKVSGYVAQATLGEASSISLSGQLLTGGNMRLSLMGTAGVNYALDRSLNLAPPNWVAEATNHADASGALVFTNTPNSTTNNFWRIRSVP